jgi:hypothetical protein
MSRAPSGAGLRARSGGAGVWHPGRSRGRTTGGLARTCVSTTPPGLRVTAFDVPGGIVISTTPPATAARTAARTGSPGSRAASRGRRRALRRAGRVRPRSAPRSTRGRAVIFTWQVEQAQTPPQAWSRARALRHGGVQDRLADRERERAGRRPHAQGHLGHGLLFLAQGLRDRRADHVVGDRRGDLGELVAGRLQAAARHWRPAACRAP